MTRLASALRLELTLQVRQRFLHAAVFSGLIWQGPLLLFGDAFHQVSLAPWQVLYALVYPSLCVVGLWWAAKAMFVRYVVAQSGGL